MSKVGVLDLWRSTNIYRWDFDTATLTPGPMDPMESFGNVSEWLHCTGAFQVSRFDFLCYFVIDTLDLYRLDLDAAASTPGSIDPIGMFWIVSVWLHGLDVFWVSHFDFYHLLMFIVSNLILLRRRCHLMGPYERYVGRIGGIDDTGEFQFRLLRL